MVAAWGRMRAEDVARWAAELRELAAEMEEFARRKIA
jgi:hypothetical protein